MKLKKNKKNKEFKMFAIRMKTIDKAKCVINMFKQCKYEIKANCEQRSKIGNFQIIAGG